MAASMLPSTDGAVVLFRRPAPVAPCARPARVFYVNGIRTTPAEHANTAEALVRVFHHDVAGVYNASGTVFDRSLRNLADSLHQTGFVPRWLTTLWQHEAEFARTVADLLQCLDDIASTAMFKHAGHVEQANRLMPGVAARMLELILRSQVIRTRIASTILRCTNLASWSLFREVGRSAGNAPVRIVAHSQGNLITCNTISALEWVGTSTQSLSWYALASPAAIKPRSVSPFEVRTDGDVVTWLGRHGQDPVLPGVDAQTGKPLSLLDRHDVGRHIASDRFVQRVWSDMGVVAPEAR